MTKWECQDLGNLKEFLQMCVTQHGSEIKIDQTEYLKKVLERFSMINTKSAATPLPSNWNPKANTGTATAAEVTNYQSIIGSLLYLMIGTRPDIAYAVTHLSQFCTNFSPEHYKVALHICQYLVGTQNYSLVYSNTGDQGLEAYLDSNWAANKIQCHSITGNLLVA